MSPCRKMKALPAFVLRKKVVQKPPFPDGQVAERTQTFSRGPSYRQDIVQPLGTLSARFGRYQLPIGIIDVQQALPALMNKWLFSVSVRHIERE